MTTQRRYLVLGLVSFGLVTLSISGPSGPVPSGSALTTREESGGSQDCESGNLWEFYRDQVKVATSSGERGEDKFSEARTHIDSVVQVLTKSSSPSYRGIRRRFSYTPTDFPSQNPGTDRFLPLKLYHRKSLPSAASFNVTLFAKATLDRVPILPVPEVHWSPDLYSAPNTEDCTAKFGYLGRADSVDTNRTYSKEFLDCIGNFAGPKHVIQVDHWESRAEQGEAYHPLGNIVHGGVSPPKIIAQAFAILEAGGLSDAIQAVTTSLMLRKEGNSGTHFAVVKPKMQIVELGCGNGNVLFAMCPPSPDVHCYGTDYSPKMIQSAQAYFGPWMDLRVGIGAGHIPSGTADLVFSNGVALLLTAHQLCTHVAEGLRLLKPGGKMVIASVTEQLGFQSQTSKKFWASPGEQVLPFCGVTTRLLVADLTVNNKTYLPIYTPGSIWYVVTLVRSAEPFCVGGKSRPHLFAGTSATTSSSGKLAQSQVLCPVSSEREMFHRSHPLATLMSNAGAQNHPGGSCNPLGVFATHFLDLFDWYGRAWFKRKGVSKRNKYWHVKPANSTDRRDWL